MFTLDQTDCRSITAPLSLSLFLASQVTAFSHLRFPHHNHRPISTRKAILAQPLRSTVHFSSPTRFTHTPLKLKHINKLKISACSHHNSTPVKDRLISAAIYSVPLLDGLGYGSFRIPPYQFPGIYYLYNSSPYIRYVAFYIILMFVIRNPKFHKYVRLNALQAILLSFVLPLPSLILNIILPIWPVGTRIGYELMFILVVFGFIHNMVNNILGKTPEFPLVTDAARTHLRGL